MTAFLLILFLWIFSVCLHEFAHAVVAYKGGDTSVREKGYLTLNPIKYLDPFTSIIFPTLVLILGGIGLPGAAVYINMTAIRSKVWQSFTSLAGPGMNLAILIVVSIAIGVFDLSGSSVGGLLAFFAFLQGTAVVLNMLPIPGFDGFGALAPFLPVEIRNTAYRYAFIIMMVVLGILIMVPEVGRFISVFSFTLASILGVSPADIVAGSRDFFFWKN
jgi:Zn-dependent protease